MGSRREFLQTSAVVSALPLTINGLLSSDIEAPGSRERSAVLHRAVFDERYREGRVFASEVSGFGVRPYALESGDVTAFWYEELDLVWREKPVAIAGLTQFGPMFVLERLANERGMRVALRVEHRAESDRRLAHVIAAPAQTMALAEHLESRNVDWLAIMAALVAHCPSGCEALVNGTIATPGATPGLDRDSRPENASSGGPIHYYTSNAIQEGRGVPWDGPLFSWVIAPAARA